MEVKLFSKNFYKYFLISFLVSLVAIASNTRNQEADVLVSTDHTKTWTPNAESGTIMLFNGSVVHINATSKLPNFTNNSGGIQLNSNVGAASGFGIGGAELWLNQYGNNAGHPNIIGYKSRGTLGNNAAAIDGDTMLELWGTAAYNTTGTAIPGHVAEMQFFIDNDGNAPTANSFGSAFDLQLTEADDIDTSGPRSVFHINHAGILSLPLYPFAGILHTDAIGTVSTSAVSLTADVTGVLPVTNGGTGQAALTANNVILGNGTSAVNFVAPGTSGNVLTSNGTTWTSAASAGASIVSWSGYLNTSSGWATSSTSEGDFSTGTGVSITERTNNGFGSVAAEGTSLPGITFTPAKVGYYFINVILTFDNTSGGGGVFLLTDGSNNILCANESSQSSASAVATVTLTGMYHVTSLVSTTFKIRGRLTGTGTTAIGANLSGSANGLEFSIFSM